MTDKLKKALDSISSMPSSSAAKARREEEKRLQSFLKPDETVIEALARLSDENHRLKSNLNQVEAERDQALRIIGDCPQCSSRIHQK